MNVHSHACFETTRSRFIQILQHCSMSWKITPLYFFYLKRLYFGQKEPVEVKFSNFWVVGWQFAKFLMSCLKLQVSFSLNFASLFSIMRDSSSVFFSWNCTWFGQNELIKVQNSECSHKISPNLYLDRLLKVYKILAEELCLMTLKTDAKFEEKLIYCFKNDKNLVKFDQST